MKFGNLDGLFCSLSAHYCCELKEAIVIIILELEALTVPINSIQDLIYGEDKVKLIF